MVLSKKILNILIFIITTASMFLVSELVIRMKNSDMKNYDIEMWRYARELKKESSNQILGHEHIPGTHAVLQNVDFKINEKGLRGATLQGRDESRRRILFLGSSITLGWGVAESQTMTTLLQKYFNEHGEKVDVLNAGVGNYNAVRYVENFFQNLQDINPTDIVIHYFVNDAEVLARGGGNFLTKHSELAVTFWIALSRLRYTGGMAGLVEHYHKIYEPNYVGYKNMVTALKRLKKYVDKKGINLYLVMTPDVHKLQQYPLQFVHQNIEGLAKNLGIKYLDLLPYLSKETPEALWAMPGDPHPNAHGHKLMAEAVYPFLS